MFAPEEQQVEICLLKLNLDEIENGLVVQRSGLPELDAENELKYRETIIALRDVHSSNCEIENLKQENVRLAAKRMQLQRHVEDTRRELERTLRNKTEVEDLLKQEEDETELEIRKYEDDLRDISERFRKPRAFHNENQMEVEIESLNRLSIDYESEEKREQNSLMQLRQKLTLMQPAVPENILDIVSKKEVHEKLKALETQYVSWCERRNKLLSSRKQLSRYVLARNGQEGVRS